MTHKKYVFTIFVTHQRQLLIENMLMECDEGRKKTCFFFKKKIPGNMLKGIRFD